METTARKGGAGRGGARGTSGASRRRSAAAGQDTAAAFADLEERESPRTGAKRTAMQQIKQFPAYLRLLFGLVTDRRVAMIDKLLVVGAIAYILTPIDLIPDFIPFLGEVDDLYLLVMALQRLVANAGRKVLLAHWSGDPSDLGELNLRQVLAAAAFLLPRRIRRRLRVIGRAD